MRSLAIAKSSSNLTLVHNSNMATIPPKVLERRRVTSGRIFHIEEADLKFSNGEARTFEYVKTRGDRAVMAIPVLDKDTILLTREYAIGFERYELGFPKGIMELGEDPCAAANREMMEEAGYGAHKLTILKEMTAIPHYMLAKITCVIAEDLYPAKLEGDEPEPLEVVPWPIADIDKLLKRDDFSEGRCIAALLMAREYLSSK